MRLNRFLASRGVDSRRRCDEIIQQGRVQVNGETVFEPGCQVDIDTDRISVDGQVLEGAIKRVYLLLNKPPGYVTTTRDPQNRPTVMQLLGDIEHRIYPVGRLDYDVEGLLLLTNDGDLSHRLIHPSYEVDKVYQILVRGRPDPRTLRRLEEGIELEDGLTAPIQIEFLNMEENNALYEMRMHEGRKRQVKRMWASQGYPVIRLKRTAFAGLVLDDVTTGAYRYLKDDEVQNLYRLVGLI